MPLTAILRNLGKMTANSVLEPGSPEVTVVCERLRNEKLLKKVKNSLCITLAFSYQQGFYPAFLSLIGPPRWLETSS